MGGEIKWYENCMVRCVQNVTGGLVANIYYNMSQSSQAYGESVLLSRTPDN